MVGEQMGRKWSSAARWFRRRTLEGVKRGWPADKEHLLSPYGTHSSGRDPELLHLPRLIWRYPEAEDKRKELQ